MDLANKPATAPVPAYMLKCGDMLWHAEHYWFFAVFVDGSPHAEWGQYMRDDEFEVALDPKAAEAWNEACRAERLKGAS